MYIVYINSVNAVKCGLRISTKKFRGNILQYVLFMIVGDTSSKKTRVSGEMTLLFFYSIDETKQRNKKQRLVQKQLLAGPL
jgi:hypothetical protein